MPVAQLETRKKEDNTVLFLFNLVKNFFIYFICYYQTENKRLDYFETYLSEKKIMAEMEEHCQQQQKENSPPPEELDQETQLTFASGNSGSVYTYIKFCVLVNNNLYSNLCL